MDLNIVIIGLGGVGSILSERISRFLNYSNEFETNIILVDGDSYEPKNYERQEFSRMGNKAEIKCSELELKFSKIAFDIFPSFINQNNIHELIKENSIVFICVDNHKSRMVINNYSKTLKNIIIISGGNELVDGNAQLYVREGGVDLTPDLCAYHPEIANPADKLPDEMSCEELSKSGETQLYFTNLGVAFKMCCMFYNAVVKKNLNNSEVYFDIEKMSSVAVNRIVKN